MAFETVNWRDGRVTLLDQTLLPHETRYHHYDNPQDVVNAISTMIVRGAPAIGVTAAFGLALAAKTLSSQKLSDARLEFNVWCERFAKTRPTAVNLFWAIERMKSISDLTQQDSVSWASHLLEEATRIYREDIAACIKMGDFGQTFIKDGDRVLTHCNAGALATAGWGTALGVLRSAKQQGKKVSVFAGETRPFLQGSRLTAWELEQDRIPVTLITDNMAGYFLKKKEIDLVIVGGDRVAANGDVANKIGTYSVAVLAHENKVPFYVAVPFSSIDLACPTGEDIKIEERDPKEVMEFGGVRVAPKGIQARHPAFDVTPSRYISAIITEKGIAKAPFSESLAKLKKLISKDSSENTLEHET